jgi:two-component system, OmpR family, sensor histidine kinase MprB
VSLRRRIATAATLAVVAVAVALGATGYLSTRSHLVGELQQQLRTRAQPYAQTHTPGATRSAARSSTRTSRRAAAAVPSAPALGGAPGYFESVYSDGTRVAGSGGKPELPVDPEVLEIARRAHGSFFRSTTVRGIHVEILTVGDPAGHRAVEVALPLTAVDSVLNSLLVTYGLLVGAGVLLAGVLGTLIARSSLAPIMRFSEQTEQLTRALDAPRRLQETGAIELRRLAVSFNQTVDALERSIQAQRHLIADASHELRTPMAALRSNIQIFLESERLPEEDREGLQAAILAELDELTQLVADVVELARGSVPSEHTETIELEVIVKRVLERIRRRAPQLEFTVELEPTVIVNVSDRVIRAVTNVIDNARKWSAPAGLIDVRLRDGVLQVRDHGPGFNEADLPFVFDRFYRADAARRMPGSGLGLAIVKQAAEAHGGSAAATNAPGGGAVLEVSFGSPPKLTDPREFGAPQHAGAASNLLDRPHQPATTHRETLTTHCTRQRVTNEITRHLTT